MDCNSYTGLDKIRKEIGGTISSTEGAKMDTTKSS